MRRFWIVAIIGVAAFFLGAASYAADESSALRILLYGRAPDPPIPAEEIKYFEHALLYSFAKTQNRKLETVWTYDFPGFERLERGEVHIVGTVLTITPERSERVDFSEPYFPSLSVLIERRGEESSRLEDLYGGRIATVRGSSHDTILSTYPEIELVYGKPSECFEMAASGKVDAVAMDSFVYLIYAEGFQNLAPTLTLSEQTALGFALRPGDPLKADLDEHIRRLKYSGELRDMLIESYGRYGFESIGHLVEGLFEGETEP